jgi:hypothetical protein
VEAEAKLDLPADARKKRDATFLCCGHGRHRWRLDADSRVKLLLLFYRSFQRLGRLRGELECVFSSKNAMGGKMTRGIGCGLVPEGDSRIHE